jgi:hypothetical protein
MESVDPQIPVDYRTLKQACRSGLTPPSRLYWYPRLPSITVGDAITEEQDIPAVAARLAAMVKLDSFESQIPEGASDRKLQHVLLALDAALLNKDGTKEIALVSPLMEIICAHIESLEVCYLMGCELTTNTAK